MPLTDKGEEIKGAMAKTYGPKKGEQVFYASKNKGKISGVDEDGDKDEPEKAEDCDAQDASEAEHQFGDLVSRVHKLDAQIKQADAAEIEGIAVPEKGMSKPLGGMDGPLLTTPKGNAFKL